VAKCDEGYLCELCGLEVEGLAESDLYLRFVVGMIDPETLHTTRERHIRCNPALAQFIVAKEFESIRPESDFDKSQLDPEFVKKREDLVTRGWYRLKELRGADLPITEYPLLEVRQRMSQELDS